MRSAVEALLAGPRGRRLCLELAGGLDLGVGHLVFRNAFGGMDRSLLAPETIDAARVREALRASIDAARYWQAPDAEDVLANAPEVREALRPIAEAVLASEASRTWSAPREHTDWVARWRNEEAAAPLPSSAEAVDAWDAGQRVDEESARRERPHDVTANWSGTWWSVPQSVVTTRRSPRDALELIEDTLGLASATLVPVVGDGRVREIASAEDWAELCREHPLEVTASRRHDWFRVTGRDGRWVIPDFRRIAEEWEAVHLTTLGYLSAATSLIRIDDERATIIAGWAPDSTLWIADRVREAGPRERWSYSPQGGMWRRADTRNP